MAAPKAENLGPFPVKEQLSSVDFCLTSNPPWHEAVILGFQHFLVMLGTTIMIATILVPQMGGGPVEKARVIQTLLLVSGLNTLLQTLVGCRTAVVIGGSYVYVIPAIFIIFSDRFGRIIDPHEIWSAEASTSEEASRERDSLRSKPLIYYFLNRK